MLLRKLFIILFILSVVVPGFADLKQEPLIENYSSQWHYIRDALFFLKSAERNRSRKVLEESAEEDKEEEKKNDYSKLKKEVFDSSNTSWLKDLFENEKALSKWMKISSAPVSIAAQADNIEMVRFLEQYLRPYILDSLLLFKKIETNSDTLEDEDKSGDKITADYLGRRRAVFASINTPLLKDLFRNNTELSKWMMESPGPFFVAIHADNVDMMRFFEQKQKSVVTKKHNNIYGVQVAITVPSLRATQFFFSHPDVNLDVVNIFEDNLFHLISLSASDKLRSKLALARIFFHEDNFPRVAHLLNRPNFVGEVSLDLILKEEGFFKVDQLILEFLAKGAIAVKQQEKLENFESKRRQKNKRMKGRKARIKKVIELRSARIEGEARGENENKGSTCPKGF